MSEQMEDGRLILVTGASGFIGGKLAVRLSEQSYRLRCQYRRAVPPPELRALGEQGAELFRLDLTPPEPENFQEYRTALKTLVDGVDCIFHVAALASDWGPDKLFEQVNVNATKELLDAASVAGVRKFVDVSSIAVHGFGDHKNSTEDGPYYPLIHAYQETKRRAEELVMSRAGGAMAVSVIRPGNVYGPGDTTMMFPMLEAIEKGLMGTLGGGKALTCPVYIDDLLTAMIAAMERDGANGEVFNITGGEWVTWKEFLGAAATGLGMRAPRLDIPGFVALGAAHLMNRFWRFFRSKNAPPLTPYRVTQLLHDYHFNIGKARRLLGYEPQTGYLEGLRKTAESFLGTRSSQKPS